MAARFLILLILAVLSNAKVVELDDYNFDSSLMIVNNKSHTDWYVLIYGDDAQSEELQKQWDELFLYSQENNLPMKIGKINALEGTDDLKHRLKVKRSPPHMLYFKNSRAFNTTVVSLERAIEISTNPESQLKGLNKKKIKESKQGFSYTISVVQKFLRNAMKSRPFYIVIGIIAIVMMVVVIVFVFAERVLKLKFD